VSEYAGHVAGVRPKRDPHKHRAGHDALPAARELRVSRLGSQHRGGGAQDRSQQPPAALNLASTRRGKKKTIEQDVLEPAAQRDTAACSLTRRVPRERRAAHTDTYLKHPPGFSAGIICEPAVRADSQRAGAGALG